MDATTENIALNEGTVSADEHPLPTNKPKKKKRNGRQRDALKRDRLSGQKTGPDCTCKRNCMAKILIEQQGMLIDHFNKLPTRNEQNAVLCGQIRLVPVAHHRIRKDTGVPNNSSYKYVVPIVRDGGASEQFVCHSAFISLYGITNRRVQTLKKSLLVKGVAPVDMRGRHKNRPHTTSDADRKNVIDHISSFVGRKAHYSRGQPSRLYLSENLNVVQMYKLFKEKYPNSKVSVDIYRLIFNTQFNIAFGYPRSDTCSTCDEMIAQLKDINKELLAIQVNDEAYTEKINAIKKRKKDIIQNQELHKRRADTFYSRKRLAKTQAKNDPNFMAIALDYCRNLPCPNITTNDVYYKRQLSFYAMNIHILSSNAAYFFGYDETITKKGADDVVSIVDCFIASFVPPNVTDLSIFCDSCAGQNKNYTVLRYLHYCVHVLKRFHSIKITFPVRGHSYLECDKDMGVIKTKTVVETPDDWRSLIVSSRSTPSPFIVVKCERELFKKYTAYLTPLYKRQCPFPTRPIKECMISAEHNTDNFMLVRNNYNGEYEKFPMMQRIPTKRTGEKHPLEYCYGHALPLKKAKYDDLQQLAKFCTSAAASYFKSLPFETAAASNLECDDDGQSEPENDVS
jgi:hypothetical protein